MSIDWITVAAQIANFLLLVWLLKRFLYRPILDGIDARETEIAERMAEAVHIRQKAEAAEAQYHDQLASFRADQSATIEDALRKAGEERDALLSKARESLEHERGERERQRAREALEYADELQRTGAEALLSLTRKALRDLADETLEERIAAHVAGRLAPLSRDLLEAAGESTDAVAITRDPLPGNARDRLNVDLQKVIPKVTLRFETDPAQAPGLILRLGGAQVAWTVDTYVDGLDALLEKGIGRDRNAGTANR